MYWRARRRQCSGTVMGDGMGDNTRDVPLAELVETFLLLRPVRRGTLPYLQLLHSIRDRGILNSICVRPSPRAPGKLEVVDGSWRYACAVDLTLPSVPCVIKHGLSDADVLAIQIEANSQRPETKPVEFAQQIRKLMQHQDMTQSQMAVMLHQNPHWISERLGLLRLSPKARKAVDRGEISLGSAYMLAKIPAGYREDFEERAATLPVREFTLVARAFIKQFQEAVRQGKLEALFTAEFKPVAYLRSLLEVSGEYEQRQCGATLLASAGCDNPLAAWYLALQWVMSLDPESVERQRQSAMKREHKNLRDDLRDVEVSDEVVADSDS